MTAVNWQRRAQIARWLVAVNYAFLLLLISAGTLIWPGYDRAPNPTIWLLQSLPLLIVLPGILRAGVVAHAWLSFIAMLYFAMAVANLAVPSPRLIDILELIIAVELFVGAMLYVRWRSRAVRALSAAGDAQ